MDLETENRLSALLMEESRRLRREADKGVHVYLCKPNVRGRPNSRFLTATVLGVEQANQAAEISDMWRAREKEHELDAKRRYISKDKTIGMHLRNDYFNGDSRSKHEEISEKLHETDHLCEGPHYKYEDDDRNSTSHCSSKHYFEDSHYRDNAGFSDKEIEKFLQSRVKRGRGSVGCRMDEPSNHNAGRCADERRASCILGPEKPFFIKKMRKEQQSKLQKNKSNSDSRYLKAKYM